MNKENINFMWLDISKFLTITLTMHILYVLVDDQGELFSELALKFFLYLVLGLLIYYFIVKARLVKLLTKSNKKTKKMKKQIKE